MVENLSVATSKYLPTHFEEEPFDYGACAALLSSTYRLYPKSSRWPRLTADAVSFFGHKGNVLTFQQLEPFQLSHSLICLRSFRLCRASIEIG